MAPKHAKTNGASRSKKSRPHRPLTTMEAHLVATVGEFVGTFLFLYFAYAGNLMAVSLASSPAAAPGLGKSSETVVFIALAYSFSLLVNVWAFYRISGGLFNPAVSSKLLRSLIHSLFVVWA